MRHGQSHGQRRAQEDVVLVRAKVCLYGPVPLKQRPRHGVVHVCVVEVPDHAAGAGAQQYPRAQRRIGRLLVVGLVGHHGPARLGHAFGCGVEDVPDARAERPRFHIVAPVGVVQADLVPDRRKVSARRPFQYERVQAQVEGVGQQALQSGRDAGAANPAQYVVDLCIGERSKLVPFAPVDGPEGAGVLVVVASHGDDGPSAGSPDLLDQTLERPHGPLAAACRVERVEYHGHAPLLAQRVAAGKSGKAVARDNGPVKLFGGLYAEKVVATDEEGRPVPGKLFVQEARQDALSRALVPRYGDPPVGLKQLPDRGDLSVAAQGRAVDRLGNARCGAAACLVKRPRVGGIARFGGGRWDPCFF